MKLLFKWRASEVNLEEEIDIGLTEEQYNKYLETGELPWEFSDDLFRSIMESSDSWFNLRKIL